jgi:hypothetical protein
MPVCRNSDKRRSAALQEYAGEIPWIRRADVVVEVAPANNRFERLGAGLMPQSGL